PVGRERGVDLLPLLGRHRGDGLLEERRVARADLLPLLRSESVAFLGGEEAIALRHPEDVCLRHVGLRRRLLGRRLLLGAKQRRERGQNEADQYLRAHSKKILRRLRGSLDLSQKFLRSRDGIRAPRAPSETTSRSRNPGRSRGSR